ncbi:hypothetical protein ACFL0C_00800 [Patescibacteria group bacterium]
MDPVQLKKVLKDNKWLIVAGIGIFLFVIVGILMLSGQLDCERTSIRGGVFQNCECQGFEVAVKSTTNSGEKKTICLGIIKDRIHYQE